MSSLSMGRCTHCGKDVLIGPTGSFYHNCKEVGDLIAPKNGYTLAHFENIIPVDEFYKRDNGSGPTTPLIDDNIF